MKRPLLPLVILLILPALAFAQSIVAVSDFTTSDVAIQSKMRDVADVIRSEFAKSNLVRVVDRSNFEQVFNELAPTAAGPVTIKMPYWDAFTNPIAGNLISAFNRIKPDITVEILDTPSADYTQKLSVMLNGGSDLDAFWIKDGDTTKGAGKPRPVGGFERRHPVHGFGQAAAVTGPAPRPWGADA